MWSRDMPREERIRSSRTPSTMASSTTSSSHNFHHHSSSNNSSPMTTREDDDGASGSPDFGKAARSSSHHHHGKVDFGGTLVVDERTPLSSLKENNNSNTNNNIGNIVIKQTPEGLPRIKTKKTEDKTQRSEFGWRDFCPGVVSVVVAFFLFSAANVVWKSGKAEEWYE